MYIIYIANRINSNIKERIIPIKHSNDLLGQLKKGYNLGEGGASQAKHNFDQAPMNLKIWPKPGFLFFLSLFLTLVDQTAIAHVLIPNKAKYHTKGTVAQHRIKTINF